MFPLLRVGPLSLPAPELALVVSFYLGLYLMELWLKRQGHDPDATSNLVLYGLFVFVIGGRLGYAVNHLPAFAGSPQDLFSLNRDLFDPFIGLAAAVLFAYGMAQRKKLPAGITITALAIFGAAVALGADLAAVASGSAFGIPTTLPWAVSLWGASRHPVQLYQLGLDLIFIPTWYLALLANKINQPLRWLAIGMLSTRFLAEAFRAQGTLLPGGVRLAQVVLLAGILLAIWLPLPPKRENENG